MIGDHDSSTEARDPMIVMNNVSLDFEMMVRRVRRDANLDAGRNKPVLVEALKNVSLTVYRGDVMGVVGFNGAGKSSLISVMGGRQKPTKGEVLVACQPRTLGVQSAFNAALTGRENITVGCLAMGIKQARIAEIEEGIIEFAEIGEFIDFPLNSYSSGMKARLSVAVASVADVPELLLLDEAMGGGDRSFKHKATERFEYIKENAGTIVMVSHTLDMVETACNRAVWIDNGELVLEGDPSDVVAQFKEAPAYRRQRTKNARGKRRRAQGKNQR